MHDEDKIIRYIEDDLSKQEKEELRKHLKSCSECRKILDQHKYIISDTREFYNSKDHKSDLSSGREIFMPKFIKYAAAFAMVILALLITFNKVNFKSSNKSNKIVAKSQVSETKIDHKEWDSEMAKLQKELRYLDKQISENNF